MRRLTRGRAATDDEATPPESGASEPAGDAATNAHPPGEQPARADGSEDVTVVFGPAEERHGATTGAEGGSRAAEVEAPHEAATAEEDAAAATAPDERAHRDLPAGLDPGELAAAPAGSARRGRLRRRLRYLRHARELLLRDLGGFYYEAHRSEGGAAAHGRLLDVKARRLATLDAEVAELEELLATDHPDAILREPGIGGTCPECGELHGSDARFCPRCGTPLTRRAARRHGSPGAPAPYEEQGRPTTASLWGRRRTPEQPPPAATGEPTQAVAHDDEPKPAAGADEPPATGDPPPATSDPATREEERPPAGDPPPATGEHPTSAEERPSTGDAATRDEEGLAAGERRP